MREHLTMEKGKEEKLVVDGDPDLVGRPIPNDPQAASPE